MAAAQENKLADVDGIKWILLATSKCVYEMIFFVFFQPENEQIKETNSVLFRSS